MTGSSKWSLTASMMATQGSQAYLKLLLNISFRYADLSMVKLIGSEIDWCKGEEIKLALKPRD